MLSAEEEQLEVRSTCSGSTSRSRSSLAKAAVEARAKAEAARARAEFTRREIEVKMRQAELSATLEALKEEKEAEAALAEANVFEAAIAEELPASTQSYRLQSYLGYSSPEHRREDLPDPKHFTPIKQCDISPIPDPATSPQYVPQVNQQDIKYEIGSHLTPAADTQEKCGQRYVSTTPQPMSFSPYTPPFQPTQINNGNSDFANLTKFLAKRELVADGLTKFTDRAEDYWAWRASFCNAIEGLSLKPSEQLDLLTRWLGEESSKHAKRIRSVHLNNPAEGLRRVWTRLQECYGTPEAIEKSLLDRLERFPRVSNKDPQNLRELGDLLSEIDAAKSDGSLPGLVYLDTSRGIAPIVDKLPTNLQDRWMSEGTKYKQRHDVYFPPFSFFCRFIQDEAKMRNDPSFKSTVSGPTSYPTTHDNHYTRFAKSRPPVAVHKTEVNKTHKPNLGSTSEFTNKLCPIHKKPHPLKKCRGFREKTLDERKAYLREHNICFRCCNSSAHQAKDCKEEITCLECNSNKHVAALHAGPAPWTQNTKAQNIAPDQDREEHGGESSLDLETSSACTQVCGDLGGGRSCSKICQAYIYPKGHPDKKVKVYAIIDDQSNRSLAKSNLFDTFGIPMSNLAPYTLKTCTGVSTTNGRLAENLFIQSVDGQFSSPLPSLLECDSLPDNKNEIPTQEIALAHQHLKHLADHMQPLDPEADIMLLLGRDIIQVHKVYERVNGPVNAPFAQRLALGWVIVGDVCLGGAHKPAIIGTYRTSVLENGHPSLLTPCQNSFHVKEQSHNKSWNTHSSCQIGKHIFQQSEKDEELAPSFEDQAFLEIMERDFYQDDANSWTAPLPFRTPRTHLPNNRNQALSRLESLRRTLNKRPEMERHFMDFMQGLFDRDHAEPAPALEEGEECWYLPFFGVYHPQKPGNIRVVFDSSAKFQGVSLNDVLLKGPNMNNSLIGVLIRFREETVAVTADIQQMFHCFQVREDHRNFLRFLWYRNNDPREPVVEYRMKVHVFGNSPSPAVAIFGLRKAAHLFDTQHYSEAKQFVQRHFYVDDGLKSLPTESEAIKLLKDTQELLAASNLRLHKIASNSPNVMKAFSTVDLASGLKDIDFNTEFPPMQRSLGVCWDIEGDTFTFRVSQAEKPYTKRGVLSTINSLFDPLGFAVPVSIKGRALLRELTKETCGWDETLPEGMFKEWSEWKNALKQLEQIRIPRPYCPFSFLGAKHREICVFCDASTQAIAAVAYLKLTNKNGETEFAFIFGKAKLAPKPDLTIPRLELCASVLAVEVGELIRDEMDIQISNMRFFSDSKVVLGYIYNEARRFHVFVNNRVQRIRRATVPTQWGYVPSVHNPADHGSRSLPAEKLLSSTWLKGPEFPLKPLQSNSSGTFQLQNPDSDIEVRPLITATIQTSYPCLKTANLESFSSWQSLTRAVARLAHIARTFKVKQSGGQCKGWHICHELTTSDFEQARETVIKAVQQESFPEELKQIESRKDIPKKSPLLKLSPYLDKSGLLRLGGRLLHSDLESAEKHPLIMPHKHHVTNLLVRYYHERVRHQGRHLAEGALRSAGYWVLGGKRQISSLIYSCVVCRKLRGVTQFQKMSDLPAERLSAEPPFSYVGIDVFGPWSVASRRTRGGLASSKRWAVMFTCMSTRAVHLEIIEGMDTSSFINALRRFFSVRGPAKQLRSDCGTNFTGASRELGFDKRIPCDPRVKSFLNDHGCSWVFNPPYSSHMGGSWERMIGVARKILDSQLAQLGSRPLTHDVLITFMAEVAAIINARPLVPVSSDPDVPCILTPATLLTQNVGAPPTPLGDFGEKDLYRQQWKRVQSLANSFWHRWRKEYLSTLQCRRKWHSTRPNLQQGDVVLLKDPLVKRNQWPIGVIAKVHPSSDGLVRKVEVKVVKDGKAKVYFRPVTDVVLLVSAAVQQV
ncbi:uncharacterized protein LOC113009687 [Astatotilapia calliptera]|uniref:uncharacterized protein LOC113009687 n=1 Tax=Astatotilapia calliptera TaxID=8154 RepID=UPI000E3FCDE7|nr:uncharacterized protein LOC113009687 [Astatotilapia calliptera]